MPKDTLLFWVGDFKMLVEPILYRYRHYEKTIRRDYENQRSNYQKFPTFEKCHD